MVIYIMTSEMHVFSIDGKEGWVWMTRIKSRAMKLTQFGKMR